ncbi:helix-turn-helix domain-containing protein [Flavobacterium johnsoniae]|uniref:Transcriptional regulator, AraC family n=1 Tax=Flavobacterium johnsoniae (strain ATCC 17061 / DSM 2064 / JCM 8514 / BCRC 14874 / CCUG 350202 / NBRC 14942 / NCIMB 11054 / UW101) TaxID=376686 RepID=A5FEP3_FLAJ1|nr:AraC family transcriptional regulator [Flavobacterium johnsoniae]ABQ06332.1 transcriptional regulator, AraC family [Flavobacterium johnsoniae UW101]OXE95335.1 DNA-binding protein [Flavobacterium johnsoniae UW101]WQG82079.1 AraC family transcriptional regulator [Flavobacterium johnsoniae UW101]SHK72178.1 transcriptional regulator, AraC family [Flavobacterium johnsoniae]
MAFKIDSNDFADFLEVDEKPDLELSRIEIQDEKDIKFATPKGDILFHEHTITDELSILQGNYQLYDDVAISGHGDSPLLEMHFNLTNQKIGYINPGSSKGYASPMSGNITFLSAEDNHAKIDFKKDIIYNTFDIHLPLNVLTKYEGESKVMDSFLNNIQKNSSNALAKNEIKISAKIFSVIEDIKNCFYRGLTRKIYMESKVYELIALSHHNLDIEKQSRNLAGDDVEKIKFAAQLIRENIDNPFTIVELARKVGVNQTKLKEGFKTVFGDTVFGYLQEIRMNKARHYLSDTSLSIQEISHLSGYQNVSNFSIAFKRIFGYPPTKLRLKV